MAIKFQPLPNKPEPLPNKAAPALPNTNAVRQAKWRAAHAEEHRAYMREYMAKKRASMKEMARAMELHWQRDLERRGVV